jgi:hypothetical protein
MLILPLVLHGAQYPALDAAKACSAGNKTDEVRLGEIVFRTYNQANDGACLQVIREGKVIFQRTNDTGGWFKIGQAANQDWGWPAIANGADITGRGHPDLIVSHFTGGAHCCTSHYVFELEPAFKLLATLDAEDSDGAYFSDLDHDHHYYYLANDWTFSYWQASFADSPAPAVILRFEDDAKDGGYHLALDKMAQPAPKAADWDKEIKEARAAFSAGNQFSGGIGSKLWGDMLDLIYAGHSDLAWRLFDATWPAARTGKDKFLADFCSQLKTSPYWPGLREGIPSAPPACSIAGPKNTVIAKPASR